MFTDRIEGKWVDAFRDVFELCKVVPGEEVAILSAVSYTHLTLPPICSV